MLLILAERRRGSNEPEGQPRLERIDERKVAI